MGVYGSSKANVLAIKKETTPGTVVLPSAGSDYVALQPDFELTPNFETLTNDEIRASIGVSKPIQGLEQPQGSFSHYMKHSGVEGTAPEMEDLLEAAFGLKSVNATQRATTVSSTASLLKLAAGGTDFARGKAVLVKDGANGYSIRPVKSVATNDLTLGFALGAAPATGVNLGKCVNFAPANSGHPTLSMHSFRGAGQMKEILAGALVTEFSLSAQAGQLINSNFTFQGTKYYFNPIVIGATDQYLDFNDGTTDFAVSIPAKIYRDPAEVAQALQDAMNATAAVGAGTYTVQYLNALSGSEGKFKIGVATGTLVLKFQSGANTANTIGDVLGFDITANKTGATSYTSDNAQSWASPFTPAYDSADPLAAKANEVMIGDVGDFACFCAQEVTFSLTNTVQNVLCVCAESGVDQKKVTGREVRVTVRALLEKHDADKFRRFRQNAETGFSYSFGTKSGGNWEAGKCGNVYIPGAVISKFTMLDLDTLIGLELELTAFVDSSGNGEVYLNFL